MLQTYREQVSAVLQGISVSKYDSILDALYNLIEREGELLIIGNGGSSATASHMVNDFAKLIPERTHRSVKVRCLSDNTALVTTQNGNAYFTDAAIFSAQVRNLALMYESDAMTLLALSGSGDSPNIITAVNEANLRGLCTIGLTGMDGGLLAECADLSLIVPSQSMQIIEDAHMVLGHSLCLDLIERLGV